jgi:hypothetical protein
VALLTELDAELLIDPLEWSAAERAQRELIACAMDRIVDLTRMYEASDDYKAKVKLSGERRLSEAHLARLLKEVKTELPPEPPHRSRKAAHAANKRWRHAAD